MSKPPSSQSQSPDQVEQIQQQIQETIKKGADPINQDLEKRYRGMVEEAQLKDKITLFESQKLIEQFEKTGQMDLNLIRQAMAAKKQLGMVETPQATWSETLLPYAPAAGLVVLAGFLFWLKTIDAYHKLYQALLGNDGLYQTFLEKIGKAKPKVSESDVFLHNKAFNELRVLARAAIAADNERFSQQEFLLFSKIQFLFNNQIKEYAGLPAYLQAFNAVLEAQKSCVILSQLEMSCQGSKQQTFYQFVNQEVLELEDAGQIQQVITARLQEVSPQVMTEDGRLKLAAYVQEIVSLLAYPQAIDFYRQFKTTALDKLQSIHSLASVIKTLKEDSVMELINLIRLTMEYYDDFEVMGEMIGLPEDRRSPDTYGRMIQYLGLSYRYQDAYPKYQILLQKLQQWYKPYQTVSQIRRAHPPEQYRQPEEFSRSIPGLTLFLKYRNSLNEQKTSSYSYVSFDEDPGTSEPATLNSEEMATVTARE
ncbi:MAG: hypothetical protein ACKO1W_00435 [Microcystaceae cyanobacterium]